VHRRHEVLIDAAVPVLVAAVIVVGLLVHGGDSSRPLPLAIGLAAAAVLWARRRAPAGTLAISGALVVLLLHVDSRAGTIAVLTPAVALYSLALRRGRIPQLLAALAAVATVIAVDIVHSGTPTLLQTLAHVMLVAIPLLAAEAMRAHRSYLAVMSERLELAERTREQEAERRAEQERMRIARELHDVVAHTLTEINVQAGAAAERLAPGDTRAALEKIEDSSRDAIRELRAILGVLRDRDGSPAPRAPTPGHEDIPELVERARQGGLEVQLAVNGEPPARLSEAVSLAAYRIVQESLTNARRHAPGAAVQVTVAFDPSLLSIEIENSRGAPPSRNGTTPGVGIAGMRERATAIGGSLEAGADRDGFRVQAELPYGPAR
jgi:signal transduction histidine kinase